jgi:hypothetical protein
MLLDAGVALRCKPALDVGKVSAFAIAGQLERSLDGAHTVHLHSSLKTGGPVDSYGGVTKNQLAGSAAELQLTTRRSGSADARALSS